MPSPGNQQKGLPRDLSTLVMGYISGLNLFDGNRYMGGIPVEETLGRSRGSVGLTGIGWWVDRHSPFACSQFSRKALIKDSPTCGFNPYSVKIRGRRFKGRRFAPRG